MSFKTEVIEKIAALVTAAFGLVAALAWNGAIQELFKLIFGEQSTLVAMFVYAVVVTIIAVIAVVLIGRHSVPVTYTGTGKQTGAVNAANTPKTERRTDLPMGKMTGSEWKKLEPRAAADHDLALLQCRAADEHRRRVECREFSRADAAALEDGMVDAKCRQASAHDKA